MQKIISKREILILTITGLIVIFSLGYNLVLEPILSKNANLNKEIGINKEKLRKYAVLLGKKNSIQNKYNKFSQEFLGTNNIGKDTYVNALSEIESLAKESNIRIMDIRPESPKAGNLYKESLIGLRIEGDMDSYLKFIYNIEKSTSLLQIKSFQLSAKPNSQVLEGTLSISQISLD
jgi:Tfp pilus assembly protein PilO